jgi:hypothetical protein
VLDGAVPKTSKDAAVLAVWLTEEPELAKDYLPKAQRSRKLDATALTVFPGKPAGPDGWAANPDASLTAVVVNDGKVAASFGYNSVNETVVPQVEAALKKALGKE